ncbi:3-oxoacyl-ACP synthase III family protein [Burkholderia ambifaria]|uniref:3-oxoacyl-ACP synthase III family protein n=1 Tax=Burkholderia ambifaria TaxID=152480 RepID=UPI00158AD8BB|nr:ketoacyl-ACP synthase III [Burkholderia ambifaria]
MGYRRFEHARIAGVSAAVPSQVRLNDDLPGDSTEIGRTAKLCGIEARHVAPDGVCASDLCFTAANHLLDGLGWARESIDMLIFLSQTPDYIVPATSCVLQHRLGLSQRCASFDMSLGCSGYIYGLMVAFGMVAPEGVRRVLLLVGDTPSKLISPHDVPANVLFGDAGTATAIEYNDDAGSSYFFAGTDGIGGRSLIIPAGGYRMPRSGESAIRRPHPADQVVRSDEDLYMDGSAVFSLTLNHVPNLVRELSVVSGWSVDSIDHWLFHQANRFMLDHFSRKLGIASERMLTNIERFGNTSPPSIPLLMVSEGLQSRVGDPTERLGLVGFGVGFSWAGAFLPRADFRTLPLAYH